MHLRRRFNGVDESDLRLGSQDFVTDQAASAAASRAKLQVAREQAPQSGNTLQTEVLPHVQ